MKLTENIKFSQEGLVPVIAQEAATGEVLMMAWANVQALEATLQTGKATYFSRSRKQLWCKGEESGNFQEILEIRIDCDMDTVLYIVAQKGNKAACHTGHRSCFYRSFVNGEWSENSIPKLFEPNEIYPKK